MPPPFNAKLVMGVVYGDGGVGGLGVGILVGLRVGFKIMMIITKEENEAQHVRLIAVSKAIHHAANTWIHGK